MNGLNIYIVTSMVTQCQNCLESTPNRFMNIIRLTDWSDNSHDGFTPRVTQIDIPRKTEPSGDDKIHMEGKSPQEMTQVSYYPTKR